MLFILLGNYKVEMYDRVRNEYVPTITGLGTHVEVRDPEMKVVLSRVRRVDGSLMIDKLML